MYSQYSYYAVRTTTRLNRYGVTHAIRKPTTIHSDGSETHAGAKLMRLTGRLLIVLLCAFMSIPGCDSDKSADNEVPADTRFSKGDNHGSMEIHGNIQDSTESRVSLTVTKSQIDELYMRPLHDEDPSSDIIAKYRLKSDSGVEYVAIQRISRNLGLEWVWTQVFCRRTSESYGIVFDAITMQRGSIRPFSIEEREGGSTLGIDSYVIPL